MKRPDYRTLQALDAVIRNEDLSAPRRSYVLPSPPSHSVLSSWKICSASRCWCVPCRRAPPSKDRNCWLCCAVPELLEEEWLGDEQTGSTPLLLSLAVNADSLATGAPALANVLSDSIRLNLQVEDETRTERLRRGEVVGAVSIQPQARRCPVDQLGRSITCLSHQKSLRNAISRMA